MEDLKSDGVPIPWQSFNRNPLPVPTRLSNSYDISSSGSTSSCPPQQHHSYQGSISRSTYSSSNASHHDPLNNQGNALGLSDGSERKEMSGLPRPLPSPMILNHSQSFPALKRSYLEFESQHQQTQQHQNAYGQVMGGGTGHEGMPYESAIHEEDGLTKPTIHPDHRLLSFSRLPDRNTLLDQYGRTGNLDMTAQIHGMFFLSEIATASSLSSSHDQRVIVQPELTCYRRNLFQISGSISAPSGPLSVLSDRAQSLPIVSMELSVGATESVDGHVIRLIIIPWKTPPPNSPPPPTNAESEPPTIPLLQPGEAGAPEQSGEVTMYQIAWRRLQFRVATANNGRRKELQQHFVLRLTVTATLANGAKMVMAETQTAPIVVRGRSPRNFQARKEIQLVGSSASPRGPSGTSPIDKKAPVQQIQHANHAIDTDLQKRGYQFDTSRFPQNSGMLSQGYSNWNVGPYPSDPVQNSLSNTNIVPIFTASHSSLPFVPSPVQQDTTQTQQQQSLQPHSQPAPFQQSLPHQLPQPQATPPMLKSQSSSTSLSTSASGQVGPSIVQTHNPYYTSVANTHPSSMPMPTSSMTLQSFHYPTTGISNPSSLNTNTNTSRPLKSPRLSSVGLTSLHHPHQPHVLHHYGSFEERIGSSNGSNYTLTPTTASESGWASAGTSTDAGAAPLYSMNTGSNSGMGTASGLSASVSMPPGQGNYGWSTG